MVVHLVSVQMEFVMLTAAAQMVGQLQQLRVVAAVDCNVHLVVHHHRTDIDLVQQIVDFVVGLVEMVSPVDLVVHMVAAVRPDIVVSHQALCVFDENEC